jgi:hypothetical protein
VRAFEKRERGADHGGGPEQVDPDHAFPKLGIDIFEAAARIDACGRYQSIESA